MTHKQELLNLIGEYGIIVQDSYQQSEDVYQVEVDTDKHFVSIDAIEGKGFRLESRMKGTDNHSGFKYVKTIGAVRTYLKNRSWDIHMTMVYGK